MIWLLACTEGPVRPSVVVISVDTLRADHVYDHPWVETPNMDALRAESLVFSRAYAAAPTTLASHTSLFSGKHPHTHGVPYNGTVVPDAELLLAERLEDAGYDTGAVVGGFPLSEQFGLDQGFDDYTGPWRNAEVVTDVAKAWLADHDDGALLFVHYWDVHHPWVPPEPWDRMYREDSIPLDTVRESGTYRTTIAGRKPGWEELNRALQGSYGGAVSYVDHHIGRLLESVGDDAIVVLVSDHGEVHEEAKAAWGHGANVHDAATRIPMVVRLPGEAPQVRAELVSNIDVTPTILAALGMPATDMEGVPLQGASRRAVFSEATMPHRDVEDGGWPNRGNCRALWEGPWKAVHCPSQQQPTGVFVWPDEETPIDDERALDMEQRLTRWAYTEPENLARMSGDEEALGQLEALGYLVR